MESESLVFVGQKLLHIKVWDLDGFIIKTKAEFKELHHNIVIFLLEISLVSN